MTTEHLIFLSVPGLRPADIDRGATPTLYQWAGQGAFAEMIPTFPCVTSPVQANMHTGTPPAEHGVIANGFYHRDRREVEFWVGQNTLIVGEQVWDAIHKHRPGFTSAVWHAQNIKGAGADFIVTPAPVHEPDGSMRPWCYSKPDGIYQELLDELGHFPLQHYWGPLANIESTRWILDAAGRLARKHAPNYHWIYIPHLDYAAQRFGPDSDEAKNSLIELDRLLGKFATEVGESSIGKDVVYVVAGEYAMTDVSGVIYPNRVLREAGLLAVREEDGAEHVDLAGSTAFAMVDHQFAHVYVDESKAQALARTCEVLRGTSGIAANMFQPQLAHGPHDLLNIDGIGTAPDLQHVGSLRKNRPGAAARPTRLAQIGRVRCAAASNSGAFP